MVFILFLYFKLDGNNWNIAICNMIPAVIARMNPIMVFVIIGFNNIRAIIAPRGSAKADINVYPTALFWLFVEV